MSVSIGDRVEILANTVHPHLEGRIGIIVSITQHQRCAVSHIRHARGRICGGNPILEVERVGRVLLPKDCVTVIEGVGAVA